MNRILIIQTAFLGDVILATSLAETLHHTYPHARIDILVKNENSSVLNAHPFLQNVLRFDKKKNKLAEILRLLKLIRSQHYDLVINIHRFFSSGLLTILSGARIKTGFSKNPLSLFFTHKYPHPLNGIHETQRNQQLISFTGIEKTLSPKLHIPQADIAATQSYKTEKYICIAPASAWFTKQYPASKWVELLDSLPGDLMVFMLGSHDDSLFCSEISEQTIHRKSVILCGQITILQSASLMKDALMNFVNDSAPLHIVSAVDAPVTAIFCSTVPAFGFGPLGSDIFIAETDETLACRPCGIHGHKSCPEKHFKCAFTLSNQKLLQRVTEKLNVSSYAQ